jgi:hypothetical protein
VIFSFLYRDIGKNLSPFSRNSEERNAAINDGKKRGGNMSKSKDIRKSDKKKPQKTVKEKKQEKIEKNKNKS